MICIICAMTEEKEAIIKMMEDVSKIKGKKLLYHGKLLDTNYYKGKINDRDVAVLHCGVGKVYASIITTLAIEKFKPDLIINLGCAGSLNKKVHVNDVVVANRVADWDVDVPGWERSLFSDKMSYAPDGRVVRLASKIKDVKIGPIVSGEQFIYKKSQINIIQKYFKGVYCGEMEGSAVANTCYAYGINFAIIRSITDEALVNGSYKNFDFTLEKACRTAAKICKKIIKEY